MIRQRHPIRQACALLLIMLCAGLMSLSLTSTAWSDRAKCPAPTSGPARLFNAWQNECKHPLCGKIIANRLQAHSEQTINAERCADAEVAPLLKALQDARRQGRIVLLGEVHDNPAHHKFRAALLDHEFSAPAAKPFEHAVVFEHIRADQSADLDKFRRRTQSTKSVAQLLAALQWSKSGWPKQDVFEPLLQSVLNSGSEIIPGDPPRAVVRKVAREGLTVLSTNERSRLHLDKQLPPALSHALLDELHASHCGMMPKSTMANLAEAQRYRDAHLAWSAIEAKAKDKDRSVTVFAGNGHVRADRGAPWHIERARERSEGAAGNPQSTLSVLLIEVDDTQKTLASYVEKGPDGRPIADFIILTPRHSRADPCIEMMKMMKKGRGSDKGSSNGTPKRAPDKAP